MDAPSFQRPGGDGSSVGLRALREARSAVAKQLEVCICLKPAVQDGAPQL